MRRREFLERALLSAGVPPFFARRSRALQTSPAATPLAPAARSRLTFETTDAACQATYTRALDTLARNVTKVFNYAEPVLIEGANYSGVWMECGPLEGLAYADIDPVVARQNHLVFFALQREDGQIPCWLRTTGIGFAQIQMVVPIAATAWELAHATGDSELVEKAYAGWTRWDAWLRRHRNTRGTGLCEGFCTWDTGHDNSPRWTGMPNSCPDGEARNLPPVAVVCRGCAPTCRRRCTAVASRSPRWRARWGGMPTRTAGSPKRRPSARRSWPGCIGRGCRASTTWTRRVASSGSGATSSAACSASTSWTRACSRRSIAGRSAIRQRSGAPIRCRRSPWTIRHSCGPIPRNSWGGASQALTALRTPRWMEHYGKAADLAYLMQQWTRAIVRDGKFLQQMDPMDGTFTQDLGDYSPAALCFTEFTWRLSGVRQAGDLLEWNVRPPGPGVRARYRRRITPTSTAELRYAESGAELLLNDEVVYRTTATARFVTDRDGKVVAVVGIGPEQTQVRIRHVSGREHMFTVSPNEHVTVKPL